VILLGLRDAVEGRRGLEPPTGWTDIEARSDELTPAGRDTIQYLSLVFGHQQAFASLTAVAGDGNELVEDRQRAVENLIQVPDERLVSLLVDLLDEPPLASPALRGLSAYDDPLIADSIIEHYAGFEFDRKQEAISTLASRKETTAALLDAIAAGTIPAKDVSIYVARQIRDYNDEGFNERVEQLWGTVRATPEEKARKISQYLAELANATTPGEASAGRALFVQTCAKCHKLFGEGASIGPEITGAQRQNTEYLLQHIVDPSAAVPSEYRVFTVLTGDGRLLNGVVPEETARTLTLQTPTERLVIDRRDIEELKATSASMMPDGQLDQLTPQQRRDLFAYLQADAQPPLPDDTKTGSGR
jgi:putative heme-binding domain-containing protein